MSTAAEGRTNRGPSEMQAVGLTFRPRWRVRQIALVCAALVVGCAVAATALSTLLPPVYGAQMELLLKPRPEPSDTAVERAMLTEEVILTSPAVLGPVAREAGMSLEDLQEATSVAMVGRSNVLRVTVADRDADRAVTLLSGIAREYAARHETGTAVDPSAPDGPVLTYETLTPARILPEPLAPRLLQSLAGGVLVGLVVASTAAVLLLRPVLADQEPRQEKPRQEKPPQDRPPQDRPPQGKPQAGPPQTAPPQSKPPQTKPPQGRPPQGRAPQVRSSQGRLPHP